MNDKKNSSFDWEIGVAVVVAGILKSIASGVIGFNYNPFSDKFNIINLIKDIGMYIICYLFIYFVIKGIKALFKKK